MVEGFALAATGYLFSEGYYMSPKITMATTGFLSFTIQYLETVAIYSKLKGRRMLCVFTKFDRVQDTLVTPSESATESNQAKNFLRYL